MGEEAGRDGGGHGRVCKAKEQETGLLKDMRTGRHAEEMGLGSKQSSKPKAEVEAICGRENSREVFSARGGSGDTSRWETGRRNQAGREERVHSPCVGSAQHVGEEDEAPHFEVTWL